MSTQDDGARSQPSYWTRDDLPEHLREEGAQHPGIFPFLRGIHPQMYTSRPWRIRQYSGFGTPRETNQRWKTLIEQGQDGISCAFDLPTQVGFDADDDRSSADAGRLGVSVSTLDDFMALFEGIPLDRTGATFNINASAPIIYAMLIETLERQGMDPADLRGTLSNDPLIEFIARGLWRMPAGGSMRLMADTFAYSLEHTPNFYPINLRASLVYEAGGSAVQEMAFGLACAVEYLDELSDRGLDMEEVTRRLSFLFFSDSDLLQQAAKFRAGRVLWARLVKERYGVLGESGQKLRFTAAIGNFNLRAQHAELNHVRNTLGALGAALGGCQAMLVAGIDEAYEIPTEKSSLSGLLTQQIIALESLITEAADPLGGSYYVEKITAEMIDEIGKLLEQIEREGGAIAAIEAGTFQRHIASLAFKTQIAEESGEKPVVGVNTPGSEAPTDPDFDLHEHDPEPMRQRCDQLRTLRANRSDAELKLCLSELANTLLGTDNSIPAIRAALRAGATLGEIMSVCVERYGEYEERVEV